jgi:hypothetical protein
LGFPTGWSFSTQQATTFLAPLPGTKEEYFQRLKKTSRVNLAPAPASTKDATKSVHDVADISYQQHILGYLNALFTYRDDLHAYAQRCDDDAKTVVVLSSSSLPLFVYDFVGLNIVSKIWTHLL